jgi:hypothetical protein
MVGSLQTFSLEVTESHTLAYNDTVIITVVKMYYRPQFDIAETFTLLSVL